MDGYKLIFDTYLALVAVGIATVMLSGIILAVFGKRRRNLRMTIAGTVVAALPFLIFWWSSLSAEWSYADRKHEIAQLKRHALPADYPRTAIVLGGETTGALKAYMVLGYVEEIRSAQSRYNGLFILGSATVPIRPISPECRATAASYLQNILSDNPAYSTRYIELSPCLREVGTRDIDVGLPDDALMIRRDLEALNREQGRKAWSNGIVEISVRRKGQETLLDYAEKPLIEKFYSPITPLPESLETGPPPDPNRMIIRMFGLPKPGIEPNS
ncbi:hypothetical protein J3454_05990 [Erythrobacter sp. NFXS35]|uniref:hypothetical protein n=1 Tax=Erythrobacter sp. NFXS35 TaxID=2818436 RepID=UPI0032DF6F8D